MLAKYYDNFFNDSFLFSDFLKDLNVSSFDMQSDFRYVTKEDEKGTKLYVSLPGVEKKNIKLNVESDNLLKLTCNIEEGNPFFKKGELQKVWKINYNPQDNIECTFNNGILTIFLERRKPKTLEITVKN